jgi:tRNA pseudouridine13 synthase
MRYNDPDVALSQSDEDQLLGLDAPPTEEEAKEGKFAALQVRLTLGTSSYATMALRQVIFVDSVLSADLLLREITKVSTSWYNQSQMTKASEDQAHKTVQVDGTAETKADVKEEKTGSEVKEEKTEPVA